MLMLSPTKRTAWKWPGWPPGGAARDAGAASSMGSFTLRSFSSISSHLGVLFCVKTLRCQVRASSPPTRWCRIHLYSLQLGEKIYCQALMCKRVKKNRQNHQVFSLHQIRKKGRNPREWTVFSSIPENNVQCFICQEQREKNRLTFVIWCSDSRDYKEMWVKMAT